MPPSCLFTPYSYWCIPVGVQETGRAASVPLNRDRLVDEALAIVDTEGFAGLSLRAVARRLAVTPMALYRYVESSTELADLVVSRIVSERTAQTEWPRGARDALRTLATTVVALIREHPVLLEAYQRGGVMTPPAMRAVDEVLAALHAHGLSPDEAMNAYVAVHGYALGFATLAFEAGEQPERDAPDANEYPALAEHYDAWRTMRSEARFLAGLELVLDGAIGKAKRRR
jgi:AcrR family transcriptional regulator